MPLYIRVFGSATPLIESAAGSHGSAGLAADELHVHPNASAYDWPLTGAEQSAHPLVARVLDAAPASGTLILSYWVARTALVAANVKVRSEGQGTGTPTLVRVGLYTVAADGALALVANTANDTDVLASAWTTYTKALAAPYTFIPGQKYAAGLLQVAATCAIVAYANGEGVALDARPRFLAGLSGQANLPSTIDDASLSYDPKMGPYLLFTT